MFKYNLWESQANIKYEINEMKFQNFNFKTKKKIQKKRNK